MRIRTQSMIHCIQIPRISFTRTSYIYRNAFWRQKISQHTAREFSKRNHAKWSETRLTYLSLLQNDLLLVYCIISAHAQNIIWKDHLMTAWDLDNGVFIWRNWSKWTHTVLFCFRGFYKFFFWLFIIFG